MEDYKKLCKGLIEDHISDIQGYEGSKSKTRKEILTDLLDDTENVFGNMDGSRTCNRWEAQQFLNKSNAIWDTDIHDLFESIDENYFFDCLKRGAETLDVVILELLSNQVINEMLKEV